MEKKDNEKQRPLEISDDVHSEPVESKQILKVLFGLMERGGDTNFIYRPTGFQELDKILLGGIQNSDLVVVAARPSIGKTQFVLNIAAKNLVMEDPIPVLIFTPEMTRSELMLRMLSYNTKSVLGVLEKGLIQETEWPKLENAACNLADVPLFIDDTANISFSELSKKAQSIKNKRGLGLLIVDGFSLMLPINLRPTRDDELNDLSRNFKCLAKELRVPVILTSYLSQRDDNGTDKMPELADLANTGLDKFADLVLFLCVDNIHNKEKGETDQVVDVSIGKNRTGSLGTVKIKMVKNYFYYKKQNGNFYERNVTS